MLLRLSRDCMELGHSVHSDVRGSSGLRKRVTILKPDYPTPETSCRDKASPGHNVRNHKTYLIARLLAEIAAMTTGSRTFSESWHRVADLRVSIRQAVPIRKQLFRGDTWYVLQDPFNNQFFRLRPEAHEFIVRLRARRTVRQVWE